MVRRMRGSFSTRSAGVSAMFSPSEGIGTVAVVTVAVMASFAVGTDLSLTCHVESCPDDGIGVDSVVLVHLVE